MTAYTILPITAFAINLIVWSYVLGQRKKDPVNRAFLLFSASGAGWLGTHLLFYIPQIWGVHHIVIAVQALFWVPLGVLFLNFAYALVGRKRDAFFKVAAVVTIACTLFHLNTELFVTGYKRFYWGIIQMYRPLPHTIVSAIGTIFVLYGLYLIAKRWRQSEDTDEKRTLTLILFGGAVTLAGTLAANVVLPVFLGTSDTPRYGSSALVIFIVIVLLAVNKYRFLSISVESVADELFDDINDGVLLVGSRGAVLRENTAAVSVFRESVAGKPVGAVLPGVDLNANVDQLVEVETAGGRRTLTVSSSSASRRRRKIGRIVIVRDVTRQKEAEAILRRSRDVLEREVEERTAELRHAQRMEAIGTFTGAIAHDFNNLLAAILGFAHAARNEIPKSSLAFRDLEEVINAGRRAREIIRQLLTFSRPEKDSEFQNVAIHEMVEEAIELLRVSLPSSIQATYDIEECKDTVRCDPVQIHQVIVNLSGNAFHAMRKSLNGRFGIELKGVDVDADLARRTPPLKQGRHVRITVSDTGHGMDPEILERIFDPFFTTKPAGEGTGLGLSTSIGIIRNHGGAITVTSQKGEGTAFSVYLPLVDNDPERQEEPIERTTGGFERILVVDDEEQMGRLMTRLLGPLGYTITIKTNSREALDTVLGAPDYDLIITDYIMPDLNGIQLAETLIRVHPEIPIIMMSGYGEELDVKEITAIGIKALLMKPVSVNELIGTVRTVLNESRLA